MSDTKENQVLSLNLSKNTKVIIIDGIRFEMDLDDPNVYKVLFEFKNEHTYNLLNVENNVDALLDDCAETIDIVLGEGACEKLFKNKDMKMYLLVNELANVFLENFMREEQEKQRARNKEEIENLKQILNGMNSIAKMMSYADNKYGNRGGNYVPKRRASKKHKNKQK